jgi:hypothetical protein
MGHAEYNMLQKYVRLATERDLGRPKDWAELIVPADQIIGAGVLTEVSL